MLDSVRNITIYGENDAGDIEISWLDSVTQIEHRVAIEPRTGVSTLLELIRVWESRATEVTRPDISRI